MSGCKIGSKRIGFLPCGHVASGVDGAFLRMQAKQLTMAVAFMSVDS